MSDIAQKIVDTALSMGYEKCGIIKVAEVAEYADKLNERMNRLILDRIPYSTFKWYAEPQKKFPWAKSIIALVTSYAHYNVPEGFEGVYGKAYMFDSRLDENCKEATMRKEFAGFLADEGIQAETEAKFGLTGLRMAAHKAGLGLIRQNNFFYTTNGSWCMLEAWLIDKELELKDEFTTPPCPENCGKCIAACPTGSLSKPYHMSLMKCASFVTTMAADKGMGVPKIKTAAKLGSCLYGCDACQDACPFNSGKHVGGEDFPGLAELAHHMSPEKTMAMDYEEIKRVFSRKFWYISEKSLWKWKINALGFMANNDSQKYKEPIILGLSDTNGRVRKFAKKIMQRI